MTLLRIARSTLRRLAGALCLVASTAHGETFEGAVLLVSDGDSLTVVRARQKTRVRLIEIDAPELKQAYGKQSRQSLAALCGNQVARITWTQKDRHQRLLGRVSCGGIDANAEQVRRGMAWVFDRYVSDRSLYLLQDSARTARHGVWADPSPIPPWEWRRTHETPEVRTTSK